MVHGVVNGNRGPADNEPSTSAINRGINFWTSLRTLELNDLFGEHTFFLDGNGLNIVEPVQTGVESAKIVSLANNADDGLELHEPEPTDIVVCLASDTEPDRELTTRQARRRVSQNTCGERATRLLRVKSEHAGNRHRRRRGSKRGLHGSALKSSGWLLRD